MASFQKTESGVVFTFPMTDAVDGDAWLAPLGVKSCDFLWRRARRGHDYLVPILKSLPSPRRPLHAPCASPQPLEVALLLRRVA